jgi:hypothetical protein
MTFSFFLRYTFFPPLSKDLRIPSKEQQGETVWLFQYIYWGLVQDPPSPIPKSGDAQVPYIK